jgi:chemosensory pili system protein ChpC
VAEIIGYSHPTAEYQGEDWFDGFISWRGVMVPVVSVEGLCQLEMHEPGPRSRIAIVYNPNGNQNLPYIGLILQDIPRAYLAEEDRLMDVITALECEYLVSQADSMMEQLVIPDLDAIISVLNQRIRQH